MGRRYERPAATDGRRAAPRRPETDEDRAQAAWKALDRGEDPTEPAPRRPPHSGTAPGRCTRPPAGGRTAAPLEWVHPSGW